MKSVGQNGYEVELRQRGSSEIRKYNIWHIEEQLYVECFFVQRVRKTS